MKIAIERDERATVVRAEGEIDLQNADEFSTALRTAAAGDSGGVVLDLLGVPFMDSSGLKALLIASAELGGRLSLVLSPGAPVTRLLDLARCVIGLRCTTTSRRRLPIPDPASREL